MPETEMPPGFDKLPIEEQMIIQAYKGNPEMMGVYQSTKIIELHGKHDKHDSRILSLERAHMRFKWVGGTILAILLAVKCFILTKVFG